MQRSLASRVAGRTRRACQELLLAVRVRPSSGWALERLGSPYGGWTVAPGLISPGGVCYCGGAGEDVSFEIELVTRCGAAVYAFDPTPAARGHIEEIGAETQLNFMPIGLAGRDGQREFYGPEVEGHVSVSIVPATSRPPAFTAPVRSVPSLMAELGHGALDVLKLDVEGAEYEVLRSCLAARVDARTLCVEIHPVHGVRDALRLVDEVRAAGYEVVARESWDFTFVRQDEPR